MSRAATSVFVYAIYLLGQGVGLLLVPNVVLPVVGLPEAADHWVRVVGMAVFFFSAYYFLAARYEFRPFFVLSVITRLSVPVIFAIFVVTKVAPGGILLLTPADIVFAGWTWWALRSQPATAPISARTP